MSVTVAEPPRNYELLAKDGDGGGSGEKSDTSEKKEPAKDSGSGDKKSATAD